MNCSYLKRKYILLTPDTTILNFPTRERLRDLIKDRSRSSACLPTGPLPLADWFMILMSWSPPSPNAATVVQSIQWLTKWENAQVRAPLHRRAAEVPLLLPLQDPLPLHPRHPRVDGGGYRLERLPCVAREDSIYMTSALKDEGLKKHPKYVNKHVKEGQGGLEITKILWTSFMELCSKSNMAEEETLTSRNE